MEDSFSTWASKPRKLGMMEMVSGCVGKLRNGGKQGCRGSVSIQWEYLQLTHLTPLRVCIFFYVVGVELSITETLYI
jgi:hypothetical protein